MKFLIELSKTDFDAMKEAMITVELIKPGTKKTRIIKELFWVETDPRFEPFDLRHKVKVKEVE